MSGDGDGRRWRSNEGREYARERRRQERDRAEVDRAVREEEVTDDTVVVGDGATVRPVPGPAPLGGLLGDVVRARGWEEQVRAARLHEAWPSIVGPQLADRSRPGRLRGGVLQVVVEAPRWATQLQYMTEQLAGRVVAETGLPVREVRVVVGDVDDD
jgi:predicted nucleic acid-binding Zn ribbon protein